MRRVAGYTSALMIAPVTYENMTRVETYPYVKDAVREGVYNALIHSCWSRHSHSNTY